MKLYLFEHWMSKWAPAEATKQYPLAGDAIDERQSVTLSSLLFLLLSVVPFQASLSL